MSSFEKLQKPILQEKLRSALKGGDILLIVPPFVTTKTSIIGPHILKSVAQQQGYKVDVVYLNLLLASIIGVDTYEKISYGQPFQMLGERLFARSAYGLPPLGKSVEHCLDSARSVFGGDLAHSMLNFEYKFYDEAEFSLEKYQKIEKVCFSFINTITSLFNTLSYQIVGCSSNWEQNNFCVAFLEKIKALKPSCTTIIGGANCAGGMAHGIASLSDSIDYLFSGEGETVFADFLKDFSKGILPENRVITGTPLMDLDANPLPEFSDYIEQRKLFLGHKNTQGYAIGFESSRGCSWAKCHYCGMSGPHKTAFRQKSSEKTLSDLEQIQEKFPDKNILMSDLVMPRGYQDDMLPRLSKKNNSPAIAYEQRPDLDLSALKTLKKAKVDFIKVGIESFSTPLLRLMKKGVRARHNVLLLRNAMIAGVMVDWNLLWGFPGEALVGYEETLELIPLIHHLCPPAVFRHICIDRFSDYHNQPELFDITNIRPWEVYRNVYPESADIDNLAYRFIGDYPSAAHENPGVIQKVAEEITQWKQNWKDCKLTLMPFMGEFMIYDKRDPEQEGKTHVINREQAKKIIQSQKQTDSKDLDWAIENKLAVALDNYYIPLITTSNEIYTDLTES